MYQRDLSRVDMVPAELFLFVGSCKLEMSSMVSAYREITVLFLNLADKRCFLSVFSVFLGALNTHFIANLNSLI